MSRKTNGELKAVLLYWTIALVLCLVLWALLGAMVFGMLDHLNVI